MTSVPERSDPRTQRRVRLAYLVSHPIQYQAPLLRRIAEEPEIDLTVFFGSDFSVRGYRDEGFGVGVKWDIPLLDGYRHEFLPQVARPGDRERGKPFELRYRQPAARRGRRCGVRCAVGAWIRDGECDAWDRGGEGAGDSRAAARGGVAGRPRAERGEAGDKAGNVCRTEADGERSAADREAERGVLASLLRRRGRRSFRCPTRWTMATLPNARARPRQDAPACRRSLDWTPRGR